MSGDYYQIYLGPKEDEERDPFEVVGPYLLLQREFEMSARRCYIESENESYIGHFALKLIEFSPSLLSFEIVRPRDNYVEVSFEFDAKNFEVVHRVAEVIFGLREPDENDSL